MNAQEAVARIAVLSEKVDADLAEMQKLADEFNITLRLKELESMWYTPFTPGGPSIEEYWAHYDDWEYFEENYPDWEYCRPGWQSSSTYC